MHVPLPARMAILRLRASGSSYRSAAAHQFGASADLDVIRASVLPALAQRPPHHARTKTPSFSSRDIVVSNGCGDLQKLQPSNFPGYMHSRHHSFRVMSDELHTLANSSLSLTAGLIFSAAILLIQCSLAF